MRKIKTLLLVFISLAGILAPIAASAADDVSTAIAPMASTRVMPLRIVEPLNCLPGSVGCKPNLSHDRIRAILDRTNSIYAPAGIKLWVKSVEYYYIPKIFHPFDTTKYTWAQFKSYAGTEDNILDVFPKMPAAAYNDTLDKKSISDWLDSVTALYGDPDELLVWVLRGSGQSVGRFPTEGRTAFITAANCYNEGTIDQPKGWPTSHFAHELGHFFGPRHPFDGTLPLNPKTNLPFTSADDWDILHCQSPLHFYTSRDDFLLHPCPSSALKLTYNYMSASGNPFVAPCANILGVEYCLGDTVVQGLLKPTGLPANPPASSDFAYNVMGYFGDFGLDTRVPAFFNQTQAEWINTYINYNVAFQGSAKTVKLTYDGKIPAGSNTTYLYSLRPKLGTSHEDFIWWSNGDATFARQTVPISGTNYQPVGGDFDGDGHDDVIWYDQAAGAAHLWWGKADRTFYTTSLWNLPTYCTIFAGNFDGKLGDDFYLYRPGTSDDKIYWSLGNRTFQSQTLEVTGTYSPIVADLDGDGKTDIFWYRPSTGVVNIWWSNGDHTFTRANNITTGLLNYTPIKGNFDGHDGDDIFWYRPGITSTDKDYVSWSVKGSRQFTKVLAQNVAGTYTPFAGDFNGDGIADIFWDAPGSNTDRIWTGSALRKFTSVDESIYGVFRPAAGDFDGDGKTDIFWYRGAN